MRVPGIGVRTRSKDVGGFVYGGLSFSDSADWLDAASTVLMALCFRICGLVGCKALP